MTGGAEHTVGRWLCDRAALTPDRVAIDFGGRLVSYRELASAAAGRAAAFAASGVAAGDRIATLARNCPEQVEVFFACALAGLVLLPLNWRLAAAELAYQIGDADPAALLAEPSLLSVAAEASGKAGGPVPAPLTATAPDHPDGPERPGHSLPGQLPALGPTDGSPLLLLYTSGTTGRPKGAVLTHANCFWTNLSLDRTAEVSGDDVVLQVLPQCHVGGWNVQPLLAWWKGARVVLEQSFDADRVLRLIAAKRVTTMMGVPTNYLMLAEHPAFGDTDLSSLRQVIVGGAPMPLPLIERWQERGVTVLQGYGLTEAAPNVLCVPAEYARAKAGSAGRPYPHVRVALRNDVGMVTGPGTGELLVAGPNVFAGYWRAPEATAAAVVRGEGEVGGCWLATGDIAERDADGFYWIRGRLKDMYISGGENVYPAEVEQVLHEHPAVAEAAVIGVPDERWGETGLAFVVFRPGSAVPPAELAAHCRDRLAAYKVPRHLRPLPELPRLTSGKIDKVSLARLADLGSPGPDSGT